MRESIPLFQSYIKAARKLPADEFKEFILMIADYGLNDIEPETENIMLEAIFEALRPNLDSSKEISQIRSEAGRLGGRPKNQTKANESKQNQTKANETKEKQTKANESKQNQTKANESERELEREREIELEVEREREREKEKGIVKGKGENPRFSPPSPEEVSDYCKSRNNTVDPNRFIDFYASKGWKVGNQPMKDWRAAVRTWENREQRPPNNQNPQRKGAIFAATMDDYNYIAWADEEEEVLSG